MVAAGDDAHGQVDAFGHQQVRCGDQRFGVGSVVEHFQFAVVHINAGVPADVGPGDEFQHLPGGDPQAGTQAGCPLENVVVGGDGVHRHQAAHGGTGDDGVLPVGKGAVVFVNVWLQLTHHPIHVYASLAPDLAQFGILVADGRVLDEAAVALGVAFHADDDQVFFAFGHVFVHAPGFAEGGILVEEDIVPVEHIHDGIPALGFFFVRFRQIDVSPPRSVTGQPGNGNIPLFNHEPILLCADL